MRPCIESRHVRFIDEPSLGLSDADFVHRMWDTDEEFEPTDDEDLGDDDSETDSEYDSDSEEQPVPIYWPDGTLYAE